MFSDVRVALPAAVRGWIYLGFSIIGLAIGATYIAYGSLGLVIPAWLNASSAVAAFLGTGVGWTAASNTVLGDQPTDGS